MNNLTKTLSTAILGLAIALGATVASAASVGSGTCSVNDVNLGSTISDIPKANDCENYAGNDSSPLNAFGTTWTQVAKNEYPSSPEVLEGIWDFSKLAPLVSPFVIVLKATNNFAAYLFEAGDADGMGWFTTAGITNDGKRHGISHISLYKPVGEVPLPAALWLFAPALLGLMGFRRRSNKV